MIRENHKATVIMNLIRMVVIIAVVQINSFPAECFGLQAFKEHLDLNYLRHGIIIHSTALAPKDNTSVWLHGNTFKGTLLFSLINEYHIRFFYLNAKKEDFNELLYRESPRLGVFMHYPSAGTEEEINNFLVSAPVSDTFNYSCSWLIVMEDGTGNPLEMIRSLFGNLNVVLNADITVGIVKRNYTLDLYDIYKICPECETPLRVSLKGKWSLHTGFELLDDFTESFVRRRNNFQNITIKVATALVNKYTLMDNMEYLENYEDFMQNDSMQRKTYQLLKMLQPLYNFTFSVQICDIWGAYSNGTWTGVMALLTERKIAFSVCPLRYNIERATIIGHSPDLHIEKIRFLFRHPKRVSIRNIFFEPLDDTVWWCVLALIVITTALLTIHARTEYLLYRQLKSQSEDGECTETHLDFMLLTILEAVFMQGPSPEQFYNNSTRVLLVSVSVFAVLLMQFYGAFIVSSLLSEPPRTLTNLAALYNSSFEIGMENISYNYEIFRNTTNQLARNIYKQRICHQQPSHIMTMEEGVQRIARGRFALYGSLDRAYRLLKTALTETEFCDLQDINFNAPFVTGIGLTKSSPYNKFVSTGIVKFRETSLLQYNDRRWEIPKIDCSTINSAEVEVDLVHFAPLLVFMAVATITATLILFAEFCFKSMENHIKQRYPRIGQTVLEYLANKQRI